MLFGHRTQEPYLLAIDAAPFAEQLVIAQPEILEGRECAVKGNRLKTSSLFATWRKLMNPSIKGFYSVRGLLHVVLRRRASNVQVGCNIAPASNTAPPINSSRTWWKSLRIRSFIRFTCRAHFAVVGICAAWLQSTIGVLADHLLAAPRVVRPREGISVA